MFALAASRLTKAVSRYVSVIYEFKRLLWWLATGQKWLAAMFLESVNVNVGITGQVLI